MPDAMPARMLRPDGSAPDLGSPNARAVYRDLLRFGPRSRSELTSRLGLSAPTVTRAARDLLDAGWLHTLGPVARAKGRPHEPLDIEENEGPRFLGVKVTADEVHAVASTVRGNVLEELTLPLESTAPTAVVEAIAGPVEALTGAHPHLLGLGISVGGRVADRRTVLGSQLLDWDQVIKTNLYGPFFLAKAALPHFIEQGFGRIVNISSFVGETGRIGQSNYAASKAGLFGLTKTLALETAGKGITVNCVIPGAIETEMSRKLPAEILQTVIDMVPMKKMGSPEDIAEAVQFLCSDKAGYITGALIPVTGGLLMM